MTSERSGADPIAVPRTAVPLGITDPVLAARAELKAALSAIEEKVNVPKQVGKASARARLYARHSPAKAAVAVAGAAIAAGLTVWAVVRTLSR